MRAPANPMPVSEAIQHVITAIRSLLWKRRLPHGAWPFVANANGRTMCGDTIYVLLGDDVPFVLRPEGRDSHLLGSAASTPLWKEK
jgi:hypothetical protein